MTDRYLCSRCERPLPEPGRFCGPACAAAQMADDTARNYGYRDAAHWRAARNAQLRRVPFPPEPPAPPSVPVADLERLARELDRTGERAARRDESRALTYRTIAAALRDLIRLHAPDTE